MRSDTFFNTPPLPPFIRKRSFSAPRSPLSVYWYFWIIPYLLCFWLFCSALVTYANKGDLPPEALATAQFVRDINDLFDVLNSSSLYTFQHKRPITKDNVGEKFERLDTWSSWIGKWVFYNPTSKKIKRSMPFQRGFIRTIAGIKSVVQRCLNKGFEYVCTRHLNQDCLEVCFTNIRTSYLQWLVYEI